MAQDYCSATAAKPSGRLEVIGECRALVSEMNSNRVQRQRKQGSHGLPDLRVRKHEAHQKEHQNEGHFNLKLLERFHSRHYDWTCCQKNAILVHWSLTGSSLYLTSIGCHFLPARLSYYCSRINAKLTRVWWNSGGERPHNDSCQLK
jgi:hypothetical protein